MVSPPPLMTHVRSTLHTHHVDRPQDRGKLHTLDTLGGTSTLVKHIHGNCTTPSLVPQGNLKHSDLLVRCRKCTNCRNARKQLWTLRAYEEIQLAPRTWFWTGTFANQTHDHDEVSKAFTLWLKRLRKHHGPVRYLMAPERHKSGAFHLHALIHCPSTLLHRHITNHWSHGFQNAKLADLGTARYVTKYITKDLTEQWGRTSRPRIRSSHHYGPTTSDPDHHQHDTHCTICADPQAELHSLANCLRELVTTDFTVAQHRPDYNQPKSKEQYQ